MEDIFGGISSVTFWSIDLYTVWYSCWAL